MDEQVLAEVRRIVAPEPEATVAARERAGGSVDLPAPEIGALLRWAVVTSGARTAVEIGAAGGITGAWILAALPDRGVLTSIEEDPHAHALAGALFEEEHDGARVRSILGRPSTVLPRLSDGAYDLALLQGDPALTGEDLAHVRRLLRPGGMLIARRVLRGGDHAEVLATAITELAEDPAFTATLLPLDGGLVLATRLADA